MLFISLKNIGERSAYGVTTKFDKPLLGLGGSKCISDMQLFRQIEFLPPAKEFLQLVDPVAAWFKQRRSAKINITIAYQDRDGHRFRERIAHDLRIYRDLGYLRTHSGSGENDATK